MSGTVYWMLQDGQPSTRQLLNSSQSVVDMYTTDAFGNNVASTGTAVNPFQWNAGGKYYSDYESGLQKVGARYYEPATGRWISQDRVLVAGNSANTQAINRYLYCRADSVVLTDPNGSWPVLLIVFVLVVLAVAASGCGQQGEGGEGPMLPPPVSNPYRGDPNHVSGDVPETGGDLPVEQTKGDNLVPDLSKMEKMKMEY